MSGLTIHENVFPFICDNPGCQKEYDLSDFKEVALLWGLIYLENTTTDAPSKLVGMVCPDCQLTSLKKCQLQTQNFSLEVLNNHNTPVDNFGRPDPLNTLPFFVPFSAQWLIDHCFIPPFLQDNDANPYLFQVPVGLQKKGGYDEYFNDVSSCQVAEGDIPALLDIENSLNYKVFPRIVDPGSIYSKTAAFAIVLKELPNLIQSSEWRNSIDNTFSSVVLVPDSEDARRCNLLATDQCRSKFKTMKQNDLTLKERGDLTLGWGVKDKYPNDVPAWQQPDSLENFTNFFRAFQAMRSKKDFELACHAHLFNKYARGLYFLKNWRNIDDGFVSSEDDFSRHELSDEELEMSSVIQKAEQAIKLEELGLPPDIHNYFPREPYASSESPAGEPQLPEGSVSDNQQEEFATSPPKIKQAGSLSEIIENENDLLKEMDNVFVLIKDNWFVKFNGKHTTVANNKKHHYIAHLLNAIGAQIKNKKLIYLVNNDEYHESYDDYKDNFTDELRKATEKYFDESIDKIYIESENGNTSCVNEIEEEMKKYIDFIEEQYGAKIDLIKKDGKYSYKIKGRKHRLTKEAEKARKNVGNNISNAIKEFLESIPDLGNHLGECISTKQNYAIYNPERSKRHQDIQWHISW